MTGKPLQFTLAQTQIAPQISKKKNFTTKSLATSNFLKTSKMCVTGMKNKLRIKRGENRKKRNGLRRSAKMIQNLISLKMMPLRRLRKNLRRKRIKRRRRTGHPKSRSQRRYRRS